MTILPDGATAGATTVAALVAHQGGWDEIALVGGPILLIIGVLAVAKRRVDASAARDALDALDDAPADAAGSGGRPSET